MSLARTLLARYPLLYRLEMRRRVVVSRWTRRRAVSRYLAAADPPCLQVGSGEHLLGGWLNTDFRIYRRGRITYLDARRPFPFPDSAFACVFTEHQIEHIRRESAAGMLRECYRVLRPGGRIRVATPDLAWVASLAEPTLSPTQASYVAWMSAGLGLARPDAAAVVNAMFSGMDAVPEAGHQFIYSFDALRGLLEAAGFRDVSRCVVGESEHPALRGIDGHGAVVGSEAIVRLETLVVEAVRP